MQQNIIGRAPIVQRRTHTFPSRNAQYFDCTQWGGGFTRVTGAAGAVVLDHARGILLDLRTGSVFTDSRFGTEANKGA